MDHKVRTKDSMKSTWRQGDKSKWNHNHWIIEILGLYDHDLTKKVPVHQKTDKVPHLTDMTMNKWIIFHAAIPLGLHQAYHHFTGRNLGPIAAFLFYSVAFKAIAIRQINLIRQMGHIYGFLDGDKHERDGVPDARVSSVLNSLTSTTTFRPLMAMLLTYKKSQLPSSMSFKWLPLEVGLYGVILDFWFYWYHRFMHDNDTLWKYHRTHHLTKHPNPLLSIYADVEQEIFDIAGIPLLTWGTMKLMGLPMGFYDWWVCYEFVVFSEIFGHSGLRVRANPPSTLSWLLRYFNSDLVIEDHDLHHRQGWKKSANYGKQTRLWDRIFGTLRDRVECTDDNIDWDNKVDMPIFGSPHGRPTASSTPVDAAPAAEAPPPAPTAAAQ